MTAVWGRSVVENANLTVQIAALRRVLDQGRADGSCIQTVAARGYRFLPAVTRVGDSDDRRGTTAFPETQDHDAAQDPAAIQAPENSSQIARLPPPRSRRRLLTFAGFALSAAALVVVGAAVLWTRLGSSPAPTTETASLQRSLNAPRLSIVVLPLANLSSDPDQQYFADGITEDLTTDLSRIADMLVISRNTAFTYKNKPIDSRQIGRELGVRYVLEGSVQRSSDRVRITTQLIDAEAHAHLWAERFDRDIGDLFAVQNEITRRIAVALHQELVSAEATRPTVRPDALEYVLRARAAWNKPPSREKWAETIDYLERALAIDPSSVAAQGWLASALSARILDLMADAVEADIARAAALAEQALAAAPGSALSHYAKGHVLRAQNRCEQALPEYETVLALNRNWVFAISAVAQCKLAAGAIDEVIPLHEQAIRISPRDPAIVVFYQNIGLVHLLQSRTDEAIHWLERARTAAPAHAQPHAWLAGAYGLNNDTERAAAELAEARRLSNDDRFSSIAKLRTIHRFRRAPKIRELFENTYYVGLRKAGMPEE
jgi:TolB-like protein